MAQFFNKRQAYAELIENKRQVLFFTRLALTGLLRKTRFDA